jgi:YesN/AraC family two-component response regulator
MDLKELVAMCKKLKVLYVEDQEDIRYEFKRLLDNFFEHIDIAENGCDGLEQYEKNSGLYDIVISDIVMPKMDGIDMSEAILKRNKDQQIIIISTYEDTYELKRLKEMGVEKYIHKPVRFEKLSEVLEKTVYEIYEKI